MSPDGTVVDPASLLVSTNVTHRMEVAFNGRHHLVVWDSGGLPQAGSVRGTLVTADGSALHPGGFPISASPVEAYGPSVAPLGSTFLVAWAENRTPDQLGVYGGRVGPDGQALDGTGFRISDGADPSNASVGFDGTTFLVAWKEARPDAQYLRVARVSQGGVVLDRFDVSRGESPGHDLYPPKVASGDGLLLVAWWSVDLDPPAGPTSEIRAARVGPDGTVLDPAGILVSEGGHQEFDVVFGDAGFLFVWPDVRDFQWDVQGTFVTTAGTVPDPDGFAVANNGEEEHDPQVAWNGTTYLVVWCTLGGGFDIYGARVDGSGGALDPAAFRISDGRGSDWSPTVAANGPFLVTWIDQRTNIYWHRDRLVATRVDSDGIVAHPGGYAVVAEANRHLLGEPVLGAAPSEGDFSLTYVRFVAEQPFGTDRAFVRTVSPK